MSWLIGRATWSRRWPLGRTRRLRQEGLTLATFVSGVVTADELHTWSLAHDGRVLVELGTGRPAVRLVSEWDEVLERRCEISAKDDHYLLEWVPDRWVLRDGASEVAAIESFRSGRWEVTCPGMLSIDVVVFALVTIERSLRTVAVDRRARERSIRSFFWLRNPSPY